MYTKVRVIQEKLDVNISSALLENEIDFMETMTADDGLFIAAALTEYDTVEESIEDPRYGELVIEQFGWGADGDDIKNYNVAIPNH